MATRRPLTLTKEVLGLGRWGRVYTARVAGASVAGVCAPPWFRACMSDAGAVTLTKPWCRCRDSNTEPTAYKAVALPVELQGLGLHGVGA